MATETFDPVAAGWTELQRGYALAPAEIVAEDEMELGNLETVAIVPRVLRIWENLTWLTNDRDAYEYAVDFHRRQVGAAGRFFFVLPELLASPGAEPEFEALSGGSLALRTYLVSYTWKTATAETRPSPLGSFTLPANNLIRVTLPPYPPSVSQSRIYATAGAAGTEVQQVTLSDVIPTWREPLTGLVTGTAAPPTVNTAADIILCKFRQRSFRVTRREGTFYELQATIEEVYEQA